MRCEATALGVRCIKQAGHDGPHQGNGSVVIEQCTEVSKGIRCTKEAGHAGPHFVVPKLYRHRRPEERLGHHVPISLNDADFEILERLSRACGRNRTETIRLALRELYNSIREAMKCDG